MEHNGREPEVPDITEDRDSLPDKEWGLLSACLMVIIHNTLVGAFNQDSCDQLQPEGLGFLYIVALWYVLHIITEVLQGVQTCINGCATVC